MLSLTVAGCATSSESADRAKPGAPAATSTKQEAPRTVEITPAQATRLKAAMIPLLQAMDRPLPPNQVKVGIMDDDHINAANAGGGQFILTTGLLEKANDAQLRAVLAHEVAHQDLGHVAKTQALGTGLSIGAVLLDQIIPGTSVLAPLASRLLVNAYTRKEEYQADAHGVDILNRAGQPGKKMMIDTLTWLQQSEGNSPGGFLATHPGTDDRIAEVQKLR
jgi:putative metalloprotease